MDCEIDPPVRQMAMEVPVDLCEELLFPARGSFVRHSGLVTG
jgi:hypothetical protein